MNALRRKRLFYDVLVAVVWALCIAYFIFFLTIWFSTFIEVTKPPADISPNFLESMHSKDEALKKLFPIPFTSQLLLAAVMLITCIRQKFPSKGEKALWLLLILVGGILGATVYYFIKARSEIS